MSITFRLSAVLVSVVLLALAGYAWVTLDSEEDELLLAGQRELRVLSRSLQVSFENALRDVQPLDIRETLERLELLDPEVDVWVFDADGALLLQTPDDLLEGAMETALLQRAWSLDQTIVQLVHVEGESQGELDRILVATPLRTDGQEYVGGMVLGRSLSAEAADLNATRLSMFALMGVVGLLGSFVAIGLGRWLVGRPMAQLLSALSRAREGDWTPQLPLNRSDEFGALAQEFLLLSQALSEARLARDQAEAHRREAERALEQADKLITVGQLSARFAHEIGSPLQVLVGRAQAITQTSDLSPKVLRHAQIIVAQGERITSIVRDFLSWARPTPSRPIALDPRLELRAILDLLELEARQRGISLVEDVDPRLAPGPLIECRPGQLQQVLFNLAKNALAVTPANGSVRLGLQLQPADRALQIVVEDTGPGVPEEQRQRLFEPFFSGVPGGLGIGLSIVRAIAQEHGATVTLEPSNAEKPGSCFVVQWPLLEESA